MSPTGVRSPFANSTKANGAGLFDGAECITPLSPSMINDLERISKLTPDKTLQASEGVSTTVQETFAKAMEEMTVGDNEIMKDVMGTESATAEQQHDPVTQAVLDKVLDNHVAVVEAAATKGNAPGWKKTGKVGGNDCYMRTDLGPGMVGVMGRGRVKATRDEILRAVADADSNIIERQTVELQDTIQVAPGDTVSNVPEGIRLSWVGLQVPMITNRDFSVASSAKADEASSSDPAARDWVVGSVSVDVPSVIPTEARKKYLRGDLLMSGWHVKPLPNTKGEESCGVTFVSVTKMNGTIPSALLKMGCKEGGDLVGKLKKYVE